MVVNEMSMKIVPVVLLACALAVGAMSVYFSGYGRRFEKNAVRARARVVTFSPIGNNGQMAPIVEFTAQDGSLVRKRAQSAGTRGVQGGDTVNILYERKKVFGLKTWNIFIVKDENSRPFRIYGIVGLVCGLLALALAAGAIFTLLN